MASELVYQPETRRDAPPVDAILSMSTKALLAFLAEDYQRHVESLNGVIRHVDRSMRLDGERLIGLAVRELERMLPSGCCWLGVTKISGQEWHENKAIHDFLIRSRRRVRDRELRMHIIYAFESCSEEIDRQMREDRESGVQVKRWAGDIDSIDDISLVLEHVDPAEQDAPADRIEDILDHYRPLCLLRFDVANGGLREMTGFRGGGVEFDNDLARFTRWWRGSCGPDLG